MSPINLNLKLIGLLFLFVVLCSILAICTHLYSPEAFKRLWYLASTVV